jgi:hypothetical protein
MAVDGYPATLTNDAGGDAMTSITHAVAALPSARRRPGRLAIAPALLVACALLACTGAARADVAWLCHPGTASAQDPCEMPLDTTIVSPDGTTRVETPARVPASQRPVDCFYVYPTISEQPAVNASKARDPEIVAIAQIQASRFSTRCRMFAPIYRQVTLAALAVGLAPHSPALKEAYGDVLEAWRAYLANDNHGRGVILIGHSQGSLILRQLIRTQIDPDPAVRRRLAGAFLLGGNVMVRAGQTIGGDFQHIPVCTQRGQGACVIAYSTYSTDPPPVSFFGNSSTDVSYQPFGMPTGPDYEVACTDPGVLSGDAGAFAATIPAAAAPDPSMQAMEDVAWGQFPKVPTTWVEAFPQTGSCRTINGAHVLRYDPVAGSRPFQEFPPSWGTHLLDLNLGIQRLVTIAALQSRAWLDANFTLGATRRNRTTMITAIAPGAGTISLSAPGTIRPRRVTITQPQPVRLAVTPTRSFARRLLRRRGATVTITVAYAPSGDQAITRTTRVHLVRSR